LAIWCKQKGLKPEAEAHSTRVVSLDPGHGAAWKQLGFKKQGNRWVTAEQLIAEEAEAEARKKAKAYWAKRLAGLRNSLNDRSTRAEAVESMATITSPRAVPSIWSTFVVGEPGNHKIAAQLLGQIRSADSSRALALLAVMSQSAEVRGRSTEVLRRREPHEYTPLLVALLRDPQLDPDPILFHYRLTPTGWDNLGSTGFLYVHGPRYNVFRIYTVDEGLGLLPAPLFGQLRSDYVERVMTQRGRQVSDLATIVDTIRRESADDVEAAKLHVREIEQFNGRVTSLLSMATGKSLGASAEAWRKWSNEERGYAYDAPAAPTRQDWTIRDLKPTFVENIHHSCFAAGTPVHTLGGLQPIESVRVGDRVLTQDQHSGALSYKPVVAAVRNKPDGVLALRFGQSVIKATGIHRFWSVGRGWVMARDLKQGDVVRAIGGNAAVDAVEAQGAEPVYNLKILRSESYFVGERGLLVHDNSPVEPVLDPFDGVSDPESTNSPSSLVASKW
jgi:hypothetical protein